MVYCDLNENILEWGSEEIVIPYRSPLDSRVHRYFPDFYIKVREKMEMFNDILLRLNQRDSAKNQRFRRKRLRNISMK